MQKLDYIVRLHCACCWVLLQVVERVPLASPRSSTRASRPRASWPLSNLSSTCGTDSQHWYVKITVVGNSGVFILANYFLWWLSHEINSMAMNTLYYEVFNYCNDQFSQDLGSVNRLFYIIFSESNKHIRRLLNLIMATLWDSLLQIKVSVFNEATQTPVGMICEHEQRCWNVNKIVSSYRYFIYLTINNIMCLFYRHLEKWPLVCRV